jgi:hypothetical protein
MKFIGRFIVGHTFDWATNSEQGIRFLEKYTYEYIFLDHDLAYEHYEKQHTGKGTGQEVADWIAQHKPEGLKGVFIHSLNPAGSDNMRRVLERWGVPCVKIPLFWDNRYGDFDNLVTWLH